MRKGENIYKRKDGRWEARYIKGYELSGKAKYGFCYGKTYTEAKEKAAKCKAAVASGKSVTAPRSCRRLAFYCEEWLSGHKYQIKESTYAKYDSVLRKYICPRLGGCLPHNVTTAAVDDFAKELITCDGLSAKTVHDILVVLHGILDYVASRCSDALPTVKISYPKQERREMRVLSREEQAHFTAYLLTDTDRCRFGVLLMLLSGIRIGELCALKWENVDLREGTIRISATLQRLSRTEAEHESRTRIVISTPKSETSARTIPLTEHAAALCKRFAVSDPAAYVLTGTEHCMEPRVLQYRIQKYTRDCGLEGVHAHTLRHTFATRAVEVGFEIKSLSEILGHAGTSITLERYVHSSMELKRANMNKLTAAGL